MIDLHRSLLHQAVSASVSIADVRHRLLQPPRYDLARGRSWRRLITPIALAGQSIGMGIDFHIALIGKQPGDRLRVDVQRGQKLHSTTLQLAQRPRPDGAKLLWALFGIEAQPLTTKMALALGIRRVTGLMITHLDSGGPAERRGLQRGDIVVYLGRFQIGSLENMGGLLETLRSGQTVRVTVLRVSGRVVYQLSADLPAR